MLQEDGGQRGRQLLLSSRQPPRATQNDVIFTQFEFTHHAIIGVEDSLTKLAVYNIKVEAVSNDGYIDRRGRGTCQTR